MRNLARSLVGNPIDAEDIVQDAWVVALRERTDVRVDLASWLRTVVRNLALRRAGRERRRPAVEERAARAEAAEVDSAAALERMELQRWLAEALLALDEPYRTAVILRHVEGLDAEAIGRAQGCTSEAARQRVARGLSRLRERLDAEQGGRERWALLLAPAARSAPLPIIATPIAIGGIVMGSKIVLGTLVAAVAALLLWLAVGRDASVPTPEPKAALAAATLAAPDEPARTVEEPALAKQIREVAVTAAPVAESEPVAATPLQVALSGRVVNTSGSPITGADVVVTRPAAGHFIVLDTELRKTSPVVGRMRTGEDGRFSFVLERGIAHDVAVSAPGYCDVMLQNHHPGEDLEVVLSHGFLVHGFVTRERDGAGIDDAEVNVFQLGSSGTMSSTRTNDDGSYELRFPSRQNAKLEVLPRREMGSQWLDVNPGPDGTVRMDVVLADGVEVHGRVIESGTGTPIPGAVIGEGWTFDRSVTTDAAGEYRMPGFGREGVMELDCKARGFGKAQRTDLPAVVDGVMRVDFELARGRVARGRVVDRDGQPVANAYVAAVASRLERSGQLTDWISGHTDPAGRFELESLTPDLVHALLVTAGGLATQVVDFPTSEPFEVELDLGDIVLAKPGFVSGTVQDEKGNPFANVEVKLTGTNADRGRLRSKATLPEGGDWYVDTRFARTDAQGRFWFGGLPAGSFVLHARTDGMPDGPNVAVPLSEGEAREDVVVLVPAGESIGGTVVDMEGHGLAHVYVTATLAELRRRGHGPRNCRATAITDENGAFDLRGLPAGRYELLLGPWELEGNPDFPWLATELDAESGGEPLRLELERGTTIRGQLLDEKGAPIVGYLVAAKNPRHDGSGTTGDDGGFAIAVRRGEVYDLEVIGPSAEFRVREQPFHTQPGIAAGTQDVILRVDPSTATASGD